MKRSVSLSLIAPSGIEPPEVPGLPDTIRHRVTPGLKGEVRHSWLVPEGSWSCLRGLRAQLRGAASALDGAKVEEWCSARLEASDLEMASLVAVALPASLSRPLAQPEPVSAVACGTCGRRKFVLLECDQVFVDLGPDPPPVLSLGRHGLLAVCQSLRASLEHGALSDSVRFIHVKARQDSTGQAYFLVVPMAIIPLAVAPYGWSEAPCPECRRGVAKYGFFPVFERPSASELWFSWPASELLTPIVNRRVFGSLSDAVAGASPPASLNGMIYGWADTDSRLAFLPEAYQASED